MRRDAPPLISNWGGVLQKLKDHLLDENGKFKTSKGLKHSELINRPDIIQMGHSISSVSGQPERIIIHGAWENQFNRITIEKPKSGMYAENVAVDIGGIAFEINTAKFWEKTGWLPEGYVELSPKITFYTQ